MEGQTGSMQDVGDHAPDIQAPPNYPIPDVCRVGAAPREAGHSGFPDAPSFDAARSFPPAVELISPDAIGELVDLLIDGRTAESVDAYLDAALARGASHEHVLLRMLQPAARRLGDLWSEDICSFVDVTLATSQLQRSMRRLIPAFQRQARPADSRKWVVLASLPGDQHTFGLAMTAEFFRRAGWHVRQGTADEAEHLVGEAPEGTGVVLGFSASAVGQIGQAAALIRRVRATRGGQLAGVLVGGPLFLTDPDHARMIGADAVVLDARQGAVQAESLLIGSG